MLHYSSSNPCETPILLLTWRRPHTLRQVIDAIRPVAPARLFVACDGPNLDRPGEHEKVTATRALIDREIDWPCHIERLYSDTNQGCRLGVSRAISWFFDHVEEGIILEDDCVPHPDFFLYCATLLEHYRCDERVWCIGGSNFQNGQWRGDGTYYFSRYPHCWGWASWRRCWHHYDTDLKLWPLLRDSGLLETIFEDPLERDYRFKIWERLYRKDEPDTWAYRWTFTCLINNGLSALPNQNLISNIGFGVDATHTTGSHQSTTMGDGLRYLTHPTFILRNTAADRYTFNNHFGGNSIRKSHSTTEKIKLRLRSTIKKVIGFTLNFNL